MNNNSFRREEVIKLYSLCIDQLKYYNTLIWQLPTGLAMLNFIAYNSFNDMPVPLVILTMINFGMLYALLRHIQNSKKIIDATRIIETQLRENFGEMIPKFKRSLIKATTVILTMFFTINLILLIVTLRMLKYG